MNLLAQSVNKYLKAIYRYVMCMILSSIYIDGFLYSYEISDQKDQNIFNTDLSYVFLSQKEQDEFLKELDELEQQLLIIIKEQPFYKQVVENPYKKKRIIITGPLLFSIVDQLNLYQKDSSSFLSQKPVMVLNYNPNFKTSRSLNFDSTLLYSMVSSFLYDSFQRYLSFSTIYLPTTNMIPFYSLILTDTKTEEIKVQISFGLKVHLLSKLISNKESSHSYINPKILNLKQYLLYDISRLFISMDDEFSSIDTDVSLIDYMNRILFPYYIQDKSLIEIIDKKLQILFFMIEYIKAPYKVNNLKQDFQNPKSDTITTKRHWIVEFLVNLYYQSKDEDILIKELQRLFNRSFTQTESDLVYPVETKKQHLILARASASKDSGVISGIFGNEEVLDNFSSKIYSAYLKKLEPIFLYEILISNSIKPKSRLKFYKFIYKILSKNELYTNIPTSKKILPSDVIRELNEALEELIRVYQERKDLIPPSLKRILHQNPFGFFHKVFYDILDRDRMISNIIHSFKSLHSLPKAGLKSKNLQKKDIVLNIDSIMFDIFSGEDLLSKLALLGRISDFSNSLNSKRSLTKIVSFLKEDSLYFKNIESFSDILESIKDNIVSCISENPSKAYRQLSSLYAYGASIDKSYGSKLNFQALISEMPESYSSSLGSGSGSDFSFGVNVTDSSPLVLGYNDYSDGSHFIGLKYFDLILDIESTNERFNQFKRLMCVVSDWWNNYQRYIANPFISIEEIDKKYEKFIYDIISAVSKEYQKELVPLIVKIATNTHSALKIFELLPKDLGDLIFQYIEEENKLDVKSCRDLFI